MKTRKFKKKTPKNQKTSTFKYNEVSVLIIWVSVSVSNPGVGASDIVSLLLLEALFMQISGVSLAPTWPCRLCLLGILLCVSLCYKLSPFQGHWER
jgi:hypothetical protein